MGFGYMSLSLRGSWTAICASPVVDVRHELADCGSRRVAPEPPVILGCGKLWAPAGSSGRGPIRCEIHNIGPIPNSTGFRRGSHPGLRCASVTWGTSGTYPMFRRGSHPGLRCAAILGYVTDVALAAFRRGSHPGLRCAEQAFLEGPWRNKVSPGFTPRPSLCGVAMDGIPHSGSFAGVHTPAFVVRGGSPTASCVPIGSFRRGSHPGLRCATATFMDSSSAGTNVSPGFTPRPSLCEAVRGREVGIVPSVSPGFTPRPSLCARIVCCVKGEPGCFAGVHTPAFVVRTHCVLCQG